MEGEEGGVAASLIIPVGEPWEGGDVEGTAKLTATPSSVSPRRPQIRTSPHYHTTAESNQIHHYVFKP